MILGIVYVLLSMWLPLGLAALLLRKSSSARTRFRRTACAGLFVVMICWLLGWLGQYIYRTHIWYSWEAQPSAAMR